jgi:MFS transporter, PAT family, beta-lactamase induction signal transducer AmpG
MQRSPSPALFFALILPYGASFGYVAVAFPYIATHSGGLTPEQAGTVVAAAFGPHAIKFLWAPIVDTTLTKKAWYLIALGLVIAGIVVSASVPINLARLPLLTSVIVASQVGLTLMGMACENLLAHNVPDASKGRAAGWHQAGATGGLGVGGGAALWLSQHLSAGWMVGAIIGGAMLACALPLLRLEEPPPMGHRLGEAMLALGRDLKGIALSRTGLLGLFICLSPVGASAATNYFGPTADAWGASANLVALVTGVAGGVVSALGAVVGGWLSDRIGRRHGYAVGGGLMALTAVAMALSPHAPWSYVLFTLTYNFFSGVAAAGYTGLVLEIIGGGAVATKYNIFASVTNVAFAYCTRLDGMAQTRWGANGMLFCDATLTFLGIAMMLALIAALRPRRPVVAEAAPEP